MQTFLPYEDFSASAKVLDRQRLGKQRVECVQLLQALTGMRAVETSISWLLEEFNPRGWVNHPAARMWRGYEEALATYGLAVCREWVSRKYQDKCRFRILTLVPSINTVTTAPHEVINPLWLGDAAFHASHRSNLLRKDPKWYGQFGWVESDNLPYVWPV